MPARVKRDGDGLLDDRQLKAHGVYEVVRSPRSSSYVGAVVTLGKTGDGLQCLDVLGEGLKLGFPTLCSFREILPGETIEITE